MILLKKTVLSQRLFLYVSCLFLLTTAVLKAAALWVGGGYLSAKDNLLQIQNVYILWGVMACELVLVTLILCKPQSRWTALGVSFMGTQFVLYRTISSLGGFAVTCPCIGNMGKAMGLSPQAEGFILSFIAAWMCLGGAFLLWYKPSKIENKRNCTPIPSNK